MHPVEIENARSRKKIDAVNAAMVFRLLSVYQGQLPVTRDDYVRGIQQMNKIFPKTGTFESIDSRKKMVF
jgi:hypothetical protein